MPTHTLQRALVTAALAAALTSAGAATPVATYLFNGNLAAVETGAPALVAIDPLAANRFETAVVGGVSQSVYHWDGSGSEASLNAGLQLNASGLVQYNNYSIEMVFEFLEPAAFGGGWRRIVNTQNRQSDDGFYVEPGNRLQVYPDVTGTTVFTSPGFHRVVLSNFVVGGVREVKAYLDGNLELTSGSDQLNLDLVTNPGHLLHFFVDNLASNAQQEFADGRIAYLRLYDGVVIPTVPEPGTWAMWLCGGAWLGSFALRRRRAVAA